MPIKNNLSNIFSDLNTESSVILPKSIKIKNIKNLDIISDATSSFMPQKGGYSDATSSFMPQKGGYSEATSSFMPQKGGYSDATSSFMPQKRGYLNGTKNKDINQLISMLSATSDDNYTANSITEQDGGGGDDDLFSEVFKDRIIESNEKLVKEIIIEDAIENYNKNMGILLDNIRDKKKHPPNMTTY